MTQQKLQHHQSELFKESSVEVEAETKPILSKQLLCLPFVLPTTKSTSFTSVPLHVARSGVFGASSEPSTKGLFFHDTEFYRDEKIVLKFSGHVLNQDDADIFMGVLRSIEQGKVDYDGKIRTNRNEFLTEIKWARSGQNNKRLLSAMKRLTESLFYYESNDEVSLSFGLEQKEHKIKERSEPLHMFCYSQDGDELALWIPKRSMALFDQNTVLDWDKRLQIESRNGLAKAIQTYISGYRERMNWRMPLDELKKITQSKSPNNKYAVSLKRALEELERINLLKESWVRKESGVWYAGWKIEEKLI